MTTHPNTASSRQNNRPQKRPNNRQVKIPTLHQVIVNCQNENEQRQLYEQLKAAGHRCRLLLL